MDNYYREKREIMAQQLKSRDIKNERILNSFLKIHRENFVIQEYRFYSYEDMALPTLNNQTISQPYIVALMTQMLNPQENQTILEIGTGSGYQGAILSNLCKEVISYEIDAQLYEFAKKNLQKSKIKNVKVINKDATSDIKYKNYFDSAIITAATNQIPQTIIDSLKENAILIIPQGNTFAYQTLKKYEKVKKRLQLIETSINVNFVPLTGKEGFK